jgi:hypothetical protein
MQVRRGAGSREKNMIYIDGSVVHKMLKRMIYIDGLVV